MSFFLAAVSYTEVSNPILHRGELELGYLLLFVPTPSPISRRADIVGHSRINQNVYDTISMLCTVWVTSAFII